MNESMKKENNKEGLYSPKGKVSLGQAVPMALQHVVAMVVGCISMPMLVAGAGGISGSEQIVMIQASLLGAAIAIFLQHYPLKGLVGSGLPVMIGQWICISADFKLNCWTVWYCCNAGCSGIRRSDGHYCRYFL